MPQRPRVDMQAAAAFATRESMLETRMKLLGATISDNTLKQYQSGRRKMQEFLDSFTPPRPTLTKELFFLLLGSMMEQGHAGTSTGEGYLYAVQFFQRYEGLWGTWATDDDAIAAAVGLRYAGKAERPETGSITRPMLEDLVAWTTKHHPEFPSMPRANRILWGAALRVKQGAYLKIGDIIQEEDEDQELMVRKDKRVRRTSRRGEVHFKPISPETAMWIAQQEEHRMKAGAKHGDWLFDPKEWQYRHLLATLKEASVALKWPAGVEWVTHSHRHGGTKKIQKEVLNQATVMSTGTRRHYTKRAKKQSALAAKKKTK